MKSKRDLHIGIIPMLSFLLWALFPASATTYYLSPSGNDANTGTILSPWKTMEKVNASSGSFLKGDTILFEKNFTYRGSLSFSPNGIAFGAYGSGNMPIISGCVAVSGWEPFRGNIWKTSVKATSIKVLLDKGISQPIGRFPQTGWRTIGSSSSGTLLVDSSLVGNWSGGQATMKTNGWSTVTCGITSQSGISMTLSGNAGPAGYGYFIQNHPDAIDHEGEWAAIKASDTTMNIYYFSFTNPETRNIEVSTFDIWLKLSAGHGDCTIQDLGFVGFNNAVMFLGDYNAATTKNIVIDRCKFSNVGGISIRCSWVSDIQISYNSFTDCYNTAVQITTGSNCSLTGNTLRNIGIISGRAIPVQADDISYQGLVISMGMNGCVSNKNLISGNYITGVGYNGIGIYSNSNTIVEKNIVDSTLQLMHDGGGIYVWTRNADPYRSTLQNVTVQDNIVLNASNPCDGTTEKGPVGYGIYLDDRNYGMTLSRNTVAFCNTGLFIHNSRNISVDHTTLYGCLKSILMLRRNNTSNYPPAVVENCVLTDNRIVNINQTSTSTAGYSMKVVWYSGNGLNNTWDRNEYSAPFLNGPFIYSLNYSSTPYIEQSCDLASWQAFSGQEKDSRVGSVVWQPGSVVEQSKFTLFDYAGEASKTLLPGNDYTDMFGNPSPGSITISPYTSLVLFRKTSSLPIQDPNSNTSIKDLSIVKNSQPKTILIQLPSINGVVSSGKLTVFRLDGSVIWEQNVNRNSQGSIVWSYRNCQRQTTGNGVCLVKYSTSNRVFVEKVILMQ